MGNSDVYEKLDALGQKILRASKNELHLSLPYLDAAIEKLSHKMDLSLANVGTDGKTIFFDPKFIADSYEKDRTTLNRTYLHILMHCLFRHIYNGKRLYAKYWDLSCDIAAEYAIDKMHCAAVGRNISDDRLFTYNKLKREVREMNAECIYEYFTELMVSEDEFKRLENEFKADDHKMWSGTAKAEKADNDSKSSNNGENGDSGKKGDYTSDKKADTDEQGKHDDGRSNDPTEKEWQELSEKISDNIKLKASRDDSSGELLRLIQAGNKPKYDYKEFLKRFAVYEEVMRIDDESFDYSFYTYGLNLYKNMPLIEYLEYKEEKGISEFVIAIDTSASCGIDKIKTFITETAEILKNRETFFEKIKLLIVQCDREIQDVYFAENLSDIEPFLSHFNAKGGGGTDFRPVFKYADSLVNSGELKNLRGLIYFTDGAGIYPEENPNFETAFVLDNEQNLERVPSWAYKLTF